MQNFNVLVIVFTIFIIRLQITLAPDESLERNKLLCF